MTIRKRVTDGTDKALDKLHFFLCQNRNSNKGVNSEACLSFLLSPGSLAHC